MRWSGRVAVFGAMALLGALSGPARGAGSPALERLKALEGEWSGPAVWDQKGKLGSVEFKLSYKVTAAGHSVVETMFPGTPGEMLTVYHLDGDELVLVHYCTSGNQPHMKLEPSAAPNVLAFRCTGGTNMTEADSHMHSARIEIVEPDRIKGTWTSMKAGELQWTASAELTRR